MSREPAINARQANLVDLKSFESQTLKPDTVMALVKGAFKNASTKVQKDALGCIAELLRVFVIDKEATARAATISRQENGLKPVDFLELEHSQEVEPIKPNLQIRHLEQILVQLLMDTE